ADRRAGATVRLLHEWHRDQGCRTAGCESAAHRWPDQGRIERASVPLRRLSLDPACRAARRRAVNATSTLPDPLRRRVLTSGGGLMIGLWLGGCATERTGPTSGQGSAAPVPPSLREPMAGPPDAGAIDTWLAIHP